MHNNIKYSRTAGNFGLKDKLTTSNSNLNIINEDDGFYDERATRGGASAMSKKYSDFDHDGLNRSTILDESVADPSRNPKYIEGLTKFLKEERYKKLGIYTEDFDKLTTFWKTHVSKAYRELREHKMRQRQDQNDMKTAVDYDMLNLDAYNIMDFDMSPETKHAQSAAKPPTYNTPGPKNSQSMRQGMAGAFTTKKSVTQKYSFEKNYEKFGDYLELDVYTTVKNDLEKEENQRQRDALMRQTKATKRQQQEKKDQQLSKIKEIIEVYFADKAQRALRQEKYKLLKLKDEKIAEMELVYREKQTVKPEKNQTLKRTRPSSAAPKPAAAKKLEYVDQWIKEYESQSQQQTKNKEIISNADSTLAQLQRDCKAMIQVMTIVLDTGMTNDSRQIIKRFNENRNMLTEDIQGGENEVIRIVKDFFSDANTVHRLVLFKEKINLSKTKADIPLFQFYMYIKPEDKLLYMVEKSHSKDDMVTLTNDEVKLLKYKDTVLQKAQEENILKVHGPEKLQEYKDKMAMFARKDLQVDEYGEAPKTKQRMFQDEYMCRFYELRQEQNERNVNEYRKIRKDAKELDQKKNILKQVFGDDFKPKSKEEIEKEEKLLKEEKEKNEKDKKTKNSLAQAQKERQQRNKDGKSNSISLAKTGKPSAIEDLIAEAKKTSRDQNSKSKMNKTINVTDGDRVIGEITLSNATQRGFADPKDKWKLGNQLKELKRLFPHDRVLERMIEEEFKSNQAFLYPEEYDLYNQATEKGLKKNFLYSKINQMKKAADFNANKELQDFEAFEKTDVYQKRKEEAENEEKLEQEMRMEKFIKRQAIQYHTYMSNRDKKEKLTLRAVLARNYHELLTNFENLTKDRFPHTSYGQDVNSETYKKSFPLTYKQYFFKLVKNIIITEKGGKGKKVSRAPLNCIMTIGSRQGTLADKINHKSMNTRLQHYKFAKEIKEKYAKQPLANRARVFKKNDQEIKKKLENVFMTFDEVENCTFEPDCGSQNPNKKENLTQDYLTADQKEHMEQQKNFFESLGDNLMMRHPKIFKLGILKKAKLQLKNGSVEQSLNTLFDGFNVEKIYGHFEPKDYKAYKNKHLKDNHGDFKKALPIIQQEMDRRYAALQKSNPFMFEFIGFLHDKAEDTLKLHPEKKIVYNEAFDKPELSIMYEEAWDFVQLHIKFKKQEFEDKKFKQKNRQNLKNVKKHITEQMQPGYEYQQDDEDPTYKDFRKIYKTIMCPLREKCGKAKYQRWPNSNVKSNTKFGEDCPYAHHPMELQFPETIDSRIVASKWRKPTAKQPMKITGPLFDCSGCMGCNLCIYRKLADIKDKSIAFNKMPENQKQEYLKNKEKSLNRIYNQANKGDNDTIDFDDAVEKKGKDLHAKDAEYFQKFGILKKASVLMFYGRANDAFATVAKAADIIKKQHEREKENELTIQKRWQFKLGLPDGLEIANLEKITEDDLNDEELLKGIDRGTCEISTLQLYLRKVCPRIRDANDRNFFLNTLIQELYWQTEDVMVDKQKNIDNIKKRVERLGEINEIYEALGSDADNDPENFLDANGDPMNVRKKKKTMCPNLLKKKLYKDDEIEMKNPDKKYYMERLLRHFPINTKTGELSCLLCVECKGMILKNKKDYIIKRKTGEFTCHKCPDAQNCDYAHNPINLDLIKYQSEINNLNEIKRAQEIKMKNAKTIEPWQPPNKFINHANIEDRYLKKKKKPTNEENEDDENKQARKTILQREDVFKKPYDKES